MLLLSQPSNQSHARKDSKFVTFVVQQQRGQEAETQPHQRVGAEDPRLSGTWAQGSLPRSVAGAALAALGLARTCLVTHQVTGPGALTVSFHAKATCPCPHLQLS